MTFSAMTGRLNGRWALKIRHNTALYPHFDPNNAIHPFGLNFCVQRQFFEKVKPLKFQWFDYLIVKPLKFQWFDCRQIRPNGTVD
jgi:hypothetical protein